MAKTAVSKQLVVCVRNDDFPVALEKRKIYVTLPDAKAEKLGMTRVIDESGEDYLYPSKLFRAILLPLALKRAILDAA